jgi:hypothetical protein
MLVNDLREHPAVMEWVDRFGLPKNDSR